MFLPMIASNELTIDKNVHSSIWSERHRVVFDSLGLCYIACFVHNLTDAAIKLDSSAIWKETPTTNERRKIYSHSFGIGIRTIRITLY